MAARAYSKAELRQAYGVGEGKFRQMLALLDIVGPASLLFPLQVDQLFERYGRPDSLAPKPSAHKPAE
jgi:hypothetical protein